MTEPEKELFDRRIHWPRGRVLGGSGSVNGLVFLRGSQQDYDRWRDLGATGWSYADVAPYFRRMETWLGGNSQARGSHGPIKVSEPRRLTPAAQAFIAGAAAAGLPHFHDVNGGGPIDGVGPVQLNTDGLFRASSAATYLRPVPRRSNLEIRTRTPVLKVIVRDGGAPSVSQHQLATSTHRAKLFCALEPSKRRNFSCCPALATAALLRISALTVLHTARTSAGIFRITWWPSTFSGPSLAIP